MIDRSVANEAVWRRDDSPVILQKEATWKAEFTAVAKLAVTRRFLLLLPAFFIRYARLIIEDAGADPTATSTTVS